MTEPQHTFLDAMLPGFQLAFFELMWPASRWIESLWIRESKGQLQLFVETTIQDRKKLDRFEYLVKEVLGEEEKVLDEYLTTVCTLRDGKIARLDTYISDIPMVNTYFA